MHRKYTPSETANLRRPEFVAAFDREMKSFQKSDEPITMKTPDRRIGLC